MYELHEGDINVKLQLQLSHSLWRFVIMNSFFYCVCS